MATGVQVWSQTAATNATIDSNVNFAEGMAPSAVDDNVRALMTSVAKWRDDNNGTLVTSGSSTAFTVNPSNQVEGALTAGYTIAVQFHTTVDSSATLSVDALTAKPMQIIAGTNLKGGEYRGGQIARFTYSSTGTGQWIANSAESAVPGVTDNSNATAGLVGEYVTATVSAASPVSITVDTGTNVTSIALTAGDWDLFGSVWLSTNGTNSQCQSLVAAISNVTADTTAAATTVPADGFDYQVLKYPAGTATVVGVPLGIPVLHTRASSASSATYYLNARTHTSDSPLNVYGMLRARRLR